MAEVKLLVGKDLWANLLVAEKDNTQTRLRRGHGWGKSALVGSTAFPVQGWWQTHVSGLVLFSIILSSLVCFCVFQFIVTLCIHLWVLANKSHQTNNFLTFLALWMCSFCPFATSGKVIEFPCYLLAGGMFWFPPEGLLGLELGS